MSELDANHQEEVKLTEEVAEDTPVTEGVVTEPVVEEPTDNAERSRLGRRFSALENRVDSVLEKIESWKPEPAPAPTESYEDDDMPMTRADLRNYISSEKKREADAAKSYDASYSKAVIQMGLDEEDDATFDAIVSKMNSDYNKKYSNDPVVDAERNYLRAAKAVLREAKKGNPLTKNEGKVNKGLGISGDTTVTNPEEKMPELDEAALEYVKKTGMTDEQVKEAFTRPSGIHAAGSVDISKI